MADVSVPIVGGSVSASVHGRGETAVILAPGAGGNRLTPLLVRLADALGGSGRCGLVYNFPYTEARRRIPDRADVLEGTVRSAGEFARQELGARRVVLGGKSMGGRIASQVVAQGAPADALVFLGYPLHPPGRPEKRRDTHLPSVPCPMLFVQGTRDAFARWDLLEEVLGRLGDKATLHRIEDGDHSFAVPRRTGRSKADVEEELRRAVVGWLDARGV
jgi:predicted alpha/beta-hydrolase family hydrolase